MRVAICVARFYEDLAERLISGARGVLEEAGVTDVDVFDVPGAYELPLAAKFAAESGRYAGVVCLGAVIRGETSHYDYVCGESARGIQDVQLDTGVPCSFGVLTVDDLQQALARSGGDKRDSGRHAAEAVLALLKIKQELAGASATAS
ncbi:MAG TPA: 6,7-dimethyl-8-ribityllumazine synthase [Baekduia sp.]|uniref:6,7-dimethyl-8-ribityllumazine synthase n=1 Tax=Baekduia sp. TaxID=2600305 RepID=UPI002D76B61E|nr:6,7-dimethyl-8-ribityllumazine synthase [Baekduia sp.]HET6508568.1 6,7-dimethyl-8-ribityllumazine synthase [Baekduia sp.]